MCEVGNDHGFAAWCLPPCGGQHSTPRPPGAKPKKHVGMRSRETRETCGSPTLVRTCALLRHGGAAWRSGSALGHCAGMGRQRRRAGRGSADAWHESPAGRLQVPPPFAALPSSDKGRELNVVSAEMMRLSIPCRSSVAPGRGVQKQSMTSGATLRNGKKKILLRDDRRVVLRSWSAPTDNWRGPIKETVKTPLCLTSCVRKVICSVKRVRRPSRDT